MAGALWKKEVVIRQNSTISVSAAQDWTKNWLASFQDDPDNIDGNGEYIDYFFGDLFDSRTGNLYRIFSEAAGVKYNMPNVVFDVLITSKFVAWTDVSNDPDLSKYPDKISTRGSLLQYATSIMSSAWDTLMETFVPWAKVSDNPDLSEDQDSLITRGGLSDILGDAMATASIVNDSGTVTDGKITLANEPSGGIIGDTCIVRIDGSGVYDEVDCSVSGNILTINAQTPGEYDGKICMVSYLVNN